MKHIGWRETVQILEPPLGPFVAKIDTGARSSCLHVHEMEIDDDKVHFKVPLDRNDTEFRTATAYVEDWKVVRDSGGHESIRPWIVMKFQLGDLIWEEEVNLTDRSNMQHRMLLGRRSVAGRFLVNPGQTFRQGPPPL